MSPIVPKVVLGSSGNTMPVIGMGTASFPEPAPHETTKAAMIEAIAVGYRHFDTAYAYGSEKPLGEAISEALNLGHIKTRDELHVTTKLWCTFGQRDKVVVGLKTSLKNLGLEYVDLYLIHYPMTFTQDPPKGVFPTPLEYIKPMDIKSVWQGMEECYNVGLAKAIGVSNFSPENLEEVLSVCKIFPAVNQVEMNPLWKQREVREFCKKNSIHITAYSPLGAPGTVWGDERVMSNELLSAIAKSKGKSVAQVSLRWLYEQGASFVPKSENKEWMKENLDIFDWSLTEEESNKISQLPERKNLKLASATGEDDAKLRSDAKL